MYNEAISTRTLYLWGVAFFIIMCLLNETTWHHYKIIHAFEFVLILFLFSSNFIASLKNYSIKGIFIITMTFVLLMIIGINCNQMIGMLINFLLLFGAKDVDFRKILRVYIWVGGGFCIVTVLASKMGIILNHIDYRISTYDVVVRQSLGYGWSTNMANHVFYIILAYFYYIGRTLKIKEVLFIFSIALYVFLETDSRLSFFLIGTLILISLVYKNNYIKTIITSKALIRIFVFSVPFFAVLSVWAAFSYDNSNIIWIAINAILSERLRISNEAIDSTGFPLFGQVYEMYGSVRDDGIAYNYIDNSYLQSFLIWGVILTIIIVLIFTHLSMKAQKRRDYLYIYSIFLASISGLISQHFIEFYMNPFILSLLAERKVKSVVDYAK